MIESGLAFLFSWNEFECCEINESRLHDKEKMRVLGLNQLRTTVSLFQAIIFYIFADLSFERLTRFQETILHISADPEIF